jgi:Piwi domain
VSFVRTDLNLIKTQADLFAVWPEYTFDVRPLAPHEGGLFSGLLVDFGTRLLITKNAAELVESGLDLTDMYLQAAQDNPDLYIDARFARRLLGRVTRTDSRTVSLTDSDRPIANLKECYVEPSLANLERIARARLGRQYEGFWTSVQAEVFSVTGAAQQHERLVKMGDWLEKQGALPCCHGLRVRISRQLYECPPGSDVATYRTFRTPNCVLRPGGTITVPWPIDRHIDSNGPYDTESFPDKRVRIAVLCPEEYRGEIDQFLAHLRDGVRSSKDTAPFRQGLLRKYRLNSCDWNYYAVKLGNSLDASYRAAALLALQDSNQAALVVIKEQYEQLPDAENPYYSAKAVFLSQGVTVQAVKIETARKQNAYILNNIALALYAKLGGVPWVLSSAPGLVHEIVVGIGSARLGKDRRGPNERVIGITTVFSGDGNYLLATSTKEVASDQYLPALLASLRENVEELKSRYNWRPKDRVRFIFHQSFKKYKDIEAEAVKQFVATLNEFEVEYAFVHVSTSHGWKLLDPQSKGASYRQDRLKRKGVPARGIYVPLGPHAALVTLTGPTQLKTELQGCPRPMLVSIHPDSTFQSLDYIAQQVFHLTFMSWRSFTPATTPVSIGYSNRIVDLLGHLRPIKNWNPETLSTKLRERRWFL